MARPLVVDVDGTLLKTDMLVESFFWLLRHRPMEALQALPLVDRPAALKEFIALRAAIPIELLPLNEDVLALIREARSFGRKVYLASASDRHYVEKLAARIESVDGVFASDGKVSLSGDAKALALTQAFGKGGFDYAGDCAQDFPVWQQAAEVIAVAPSARFFDEVRQQFPHARALGRAPGWAEHVDAMRIHQWLKNVLLFVPMLAAHDFSLLNIVAAWIAFFSFSFCASSVYILNDLLDLSYDRVHPTKRRRMLASGTISARTAVIMIPALLALSGGLALFLPRAFMVTLVIYYLATLAYSLYIKQKLLLDVITLANLYCLRLFAGSTLGIPLSDWLLAFSMFLFLSLAMLKRASELIASVASQKESRPSGRGYIPGDIPIIGAMAAASGYMAVLVLSLYIHSPDVLSFYHHPHRLWGVCMVLLYWISHMLFVTFRGTMHEDPVLFAGSDSVSWACGGVCLVIVLSSI